MVLPPSPESPAACVANTRFLRIEDYTGIAAILTVGEIEAMVGGVNVALGRHVKASPQLTATNKDYFAVDGVRDKAPADNVYASVSAIGNFLEVDLGMAYCLDRVHVFNDMGYLNGIENFKLQLLDTARTVLAEHPFTKSRYQNFDPRTTIPTIGRRFRMPQTISTGVTAREVKILQSGVNIATGKTATMRTHNPTYPAADLLDGDTTNSCRDAGSADMLEWIDVDLGSMMDVDNIILYTGVDWCPTCDDDALGLFVDAHDNVVAAWMLTHRFVQELPVANTSTMHCNVRHLRIERGNSAEDLAFQEVMAFDNTGANVVVGKTATSSTPAPYGPEYAIDQAFDIWELNPTTQPQPQFATTASAVNSWWSIDLGATYCIERVWILGIARDVATTSHSEYVRDASVMLVNAANEPIRVMPYMQSPAKSIRHYTPYAQNFLFNADYFPVNPGCKMVRYLRIERYTAEYLIPLEVEAYAGDLNVALGADVTMSSSHDTQSWPYSLTDGHFRDTGYRRAHTGTGLGQWVEVDLGREWCIDRAVWRSRKGSEVHYRQAGTNFTAMDAARTVLGYNDVSDQNVINESPTYVWIHFQPLPTIGQFLQIEQSRNTFIEVEEIKVVSNGVNVAMGKPVSAHHQNSNVGVPWDLQRATDNLTATVSCCSTAYLMAGTTSAAHGWLEINLQASYDIDAIIVDQAYALRFLNDDMCLWSAAHARLRCWALNKTNVQGFFLKQPAPHCGIRYARVWKGHNSYNYFFQEVSFYRNGVNMAVDKTVNQNPAGSYPSTGDKYNGNDEMIWPISPWRMVHPDTTQSNANFWWEVDFGEPICIDYMTFVSRLLAAEPVAPQKMTFLLLNEAKEPINGYIHQPTHSFGGQWIINPTYDPGTEPGCVNMRYVKVNRTEDISVAIVEYFVIQSLEVWQNRLNRAATNRDDGATAGAVASALNINSYHDPVLAIDNADAYYSFYHSTNGARTNYLEVDLGATYCISVVHVSGQNGYSYRMKGAEIHFMDENREAVAEKLTCGNPYDTTYRGQYYTKWFATPPNNPRHLLLHQEQNTWLQVLEVQAWSGATNAAQGKLAYEWTKNAANLGAEKAVDGVIDSNNGNLFVSTSHHFAYMWVDLGAETVIDKVVIWNRRNYPGRMKWAGFKALDSHFRVASETFMLWDNFTQILQLAQPYSPCGVRYVRAQSCRSSWFSLLYFGIYHNNVLINAPAAAYSSSFSASAGFDNTRLTKPFWRVSQEITTTKLGWKSAGASFDNWVEVDLGADFCVDWIHADFSLAQDGSDKIWAAESSIITYDANHRPINSEDHDRVARGVNYHRVDHKRTYKNESALPGCIAGVQFVHVVTLATQSLSFTELEVWQGPFNVALHDETTQTLTAPAAGWTSNAPTMGCVIGNCGFAHTSAATGRTWTLDLKQEYCIDQVTIFSRNVWSERLADLDIRLFAADGTTQLYNWLSESSMAGTTQQTFVPHTVTPSNLTQHVDVFPDVDATYFRDLSIVSGLAATPADHTRDAGAEAWLHTPLGANVASNCIDHDLSTFCQQSRNKENPFSLTLPTEADADLVVFYADPITVTRYIDQSLWIRDHQMKTTMSLHMGSTGKGTYAWKLKPDLVLPHCGIRYINVIPNNMAAASMAEVQVFAGGVNIAAGKPFTTKVTPGTGTDTKCNDLMTMPFAENNNFAEDCSTGGKSGYFELDLESELCIDYVALHAATVDNRGLGADAIVIAENAARVPINYFELTSLQTIYSWWINPTYAPTPRDSTNCRSARFIRITNNQGVSQKVRVAEVEAWVGPINVALQKSVTCFPSCTAGNPETKTTDGNSWGYQSDYGVSLTTANINAYIEVDLGQEYCLDQVRIIGAKSHYNEFKYTKVAIETDTRVAVYDEFWPFFGESFVCENLIKFSPFVNGTIRFVKMEQGQNYQYIQMLELMIMSNGVNLAKNKPVHTSHNHYSTQAAAKAVDEAFYPSGTGYISSLNYNNEWLVDLQGDYAVDAFFYWNLGTSRGRAHQQRLNFFDKNFVPLHSQVLLDRKTQGFLFNENASDLHCGIRYIRWETGKGLNVKFCEIAVFQNGVNIAPGKAFTTSPTTYGTASTCVDGSYDFNDVAAYLPTSHCGMTTNSDDNYWELDLGSEMCIDYVSMHTCAQDFSANVQESSFLALDANHYPTNHEAIEVKATIHHWVINKTFVPQGHSGCKWGRFVRVEQNSALKIDMSEVEVHSGTMNVALNKTASQSSGTDAAECIDGNNRRGVAGTACGTIVNVGWWEVDLHQEYCIDTIALMMGTTVAERSGLDIKLLDSARSPVQTFNNGANDDCVQLFHIAEKQNHTRFVQLQANQGANNYFHPFEVMALKDGVNVALNKPASLSSQYSSYVPSNCVDGNLATQCHTGSEADRRVHVDLQSSFELDAVVVYHNVGSATLINRLTAACLVAYDENMVPIRAVRMVDRSVQMMYLFGGPQPCNTRYVRLETAVVTTISLQEVMVFSGGVNVALSGTATQQNNLNANTVASNCIDNIVADGWKGTTDHLCATSGAAVDDWWELDLGSDMCVDFIQVIGRTVGTVAETQTTMTLNGLTLRSNRVPIQVHHLTTDHRQIMLTNISYVPHIEGCSLARYARVERTTTGILSLYELQVFSGPLNVALGKSSTQSSAAAGNVDRGCVDGSTQTTSMCQTNSEMAWWEVDMGSTFCISSVVAYSYEPDILRMQYSNIKLLDETRNEVRSFTISIESSVQMFHITPVPNRTRYVRIEGAQNDYLQAREIYLVQDGINIATGKSTMQVMDFDGTTVSSKGNDNDASFSGSNFVTQASYDSWWQLDLGSMEVLGAIAVYNRIDDTPSRLDRAALLLLDEFLSPVTIFPLNADPIQMRYMQEPPTCGIRYVRIEVDSAKSISMTEMQVYSSGVNIAQGKTASQYSTETASNGEDYSAAACVDGDYSTKVPAASCTTTAHAAAYWEVDLGQEYCLQRILVVNRGDNPGQGWYTLFDMHHLLGLSGTRAPLRHWRTNTDQMQLYGIEPLETRTVQYVKVLKQIGSVQMREVEVFNGDIPLAKNKATTSSSVRSPPYADGSGPEICVDGDSTIVYNNSLCVTQWGHDQWWQIDLGEEFCVGVIKIYNRADCCAHFLNRASAIFYDKMFNILDIIGLTSAVEQEGYTSTRGGCTATPTLTQSKLPTLSRSITLSISGTATITPPPTPTSTGTKSLSLSFSPTLTFSPTPSGSPTKSPTGSETVPETASETVPLTDSPTVTVTATDTQSRSKSPTQTEILTETHTVTPSRTPTKSVSLSHTTSLTVTPPPTPTNSFSLSNSFSPTITPGPTPTASWTITPPSMTIPVYTRTPTDTTNLFYAAALRARSERYNQTAHHLFRAQNISMVTYNKPDKAFQVTLMGISHNFTDIPRDIWDIQAGFDVIVKYNQFEKFDDLIHCYYGYPCVLHLDLSLTGVYSLEFTPSYIPAPWIPLQKFALDVTIKDGLDTTEHHLAFATSMIPASTAAATPLNFHVGVRTASNGSLTVSKMEGQLVTVSMWTAVCTTPQTVTAPIRSNVAVFSNVRLTGFEQCGNPVMLQAAATGVLPSDTTGIVVKNCPRRPKGSLIVDGVFRVPNSPLKYVKTTNFHRAHFAVTIFHPLPPIFPATLLPTCELEGLETGPVTRINDCYVQCEIDASSETFEDIPLSLVYEHETLKDPMKIFLDRISTSGRPATIRVENRGASHFHVSKRFQKIVLPQCFIVKYMNERGIQVKFPGAAYNRLTVANIPNITLDNHTAAFHVCNISVVAVNGTTPLHFRTPHFNHTLYLTFTFDHDLCKAPEEMAPTSGCNGVCAPGSNVLCNCTNDFTVLSTTYYESGSPIRRHLVNGMPCATMVANQTHPNVAKATSTGCPFPDPYNQIDSTGGPIFTLFHNGKYLRHDRTMLYQPPPPPPFQAITHVSGCFDAHPSTGGCFQTGNNIFSIYGRNLPGDVNVSFYDISWGENVCEEATWVDATKIVAKRCVGLGQGKQIVLRSATNGTELLKSTDLVTVSYEALNETKCYRDSNSNPCGAHGDCDPPTGECQCYFSPETGFWIGSRCDTCGVYYNGSETSNCTTRCPTFNGLICSNKGLCDNGNCTCDQGYAGWACETQCPGQGTCFDHGVCQLDGTCACYTNYTHGFWGGDASCTTCAWGKTGPDCDLDCPMSDGLVCGGHGICDITCKCDIANWYCGDACEVHGEICITCPVDGQWGPNCEFWCPNAEDGLPCNGNGFCHGGKEGTGLCFCDTGFWGAECENICPGGASNPCSGHGTCNVSSGVCQCDDYFATTDCSVECPGHATNDTCSSHGVCDYGHAAKGQCTCARGWTESDCGTQCPGGHLTPCNNKGECLRNATCQCLSDPEKGYWGGNDCSVCDLDWFGPKCNQQCLKKNGNMCNAKGTCSPDVTCKCTGDDESGYWGGEVCDLCKVGYFGPSCTGECPGGWCNMCNGHGNCSHGLNGTGGCECANSIELGGFWTGDNACSNCHPLYWSENCSMLCTGYDPALGTACHGHGVCSNGIGGDGTCFCEGKYDNDDDGSCNECVDGYYGPSCLECGMTPLCSPNAGPCCGRGNCSDGIAGTGQCACELGFNGTYCEYQCPILLGQTCGPGGYCDRGNCTCTGNYIQSLFAASGACVECREGYWGTYCQNECPKCVNGTCNYNDGTCNCNDGWWGELCENQCPGGADNYCSGNGHCTAEGACDCYANRTHGYWVGDTCSKCSPYYDSTYCNQTCPTSGGVICNGRGSCWNGTCTGCGPVYGDRESLWCGTGCNLKGIQCLDLSYDCDEGFFGVGCVGLCPGANPDGTNACQSQGTCDMLYGTCYCQYGLFGADCSFKCPTSNVAGRILPCGGRGACSDGGQCLCNAGYFGTSCQNECPGGADTPCFNHGECDTSTGACTCELGSTGIDCATPCPGGRRTPCFNRGVCNEDATCTCFQSPTQGFWGGDDCHGCVQGFGGGSCTVRCVVDNSYGSTGSHCRCRPGYSGIDCSIECPGMSEGALCNSHGTCNDGSLQIGTCTCDKDWYDVGCTTHCTVDKCQKQGLVFPQCNVANGTCECQDTQTGHFGGPTCEDCVEGFYGVFCTLKCPCNDHGGCTRYTGDCLCFRDDARGFWGGKFCDRCAKGYIGVDCLSKNVELSTNPSISQNVALRVIDKYASSIYLYDREHDVYYVGNRPLVAMRFAASATATSSTNFINEVDFGYALQSATIVGNVLVVGYQYVNRTLSLVEMRYFSVPRGASFRESAVEEFYFPVASPPVAARKFTVQNTFPQTERILCTDVSRYVQVELSPSADIVIKNTYNHSTFNVFNVSQHKVESVKFAYVDSRTGAIVVTGSRVRTTGVLVQTHWAIAVFFPSSDGAEWYPTFTNFSSDLVALSACENENDLSVTCRTAHRCLLRNNLWLSCFMEQSTGPVVASFPADPSLFTMGIDAHGNSNGLVVNTASNQIIVTATKEMNVTAMLLDEEMGLGYAAMNLAAEASTIYKFHLDTAVASGDIVFGKHAQDYDIVSAMELLPHLREAKIVFVRTFSIEVASVNLFGVKNVEPSMVDSLGGTPVNVTGEGFSPFATIYCNFGHTASPTKAQIISSSLIQCTATQSGSSGASCIPDNFNIRIGDRITDTTNVQIQRPVSPVIRGIVNQFGDVGFSDSAVRTTITLVGFGFQRSKWAACRFVDPRRDTITNFGPVGFVNGSAVTCVQPSGLFPSSQGSYIEYSHDGHVFQAQHRYEVVGGPSMLKIVAGRTVTEQYGIQSNAVTFLPEIVVEVGDVEGNSLRRLHTQNVAVEAQIEASSVHNTNWANHSSALRISSRGSVTFEKLAFAAPRKGKIHVFFKALTGVYLANAELYVKVLVGDPHQLLLDSHPHAVQNWLVGISPKVLQPAPEVVIADVAGNKIHDRAALPAIVVCEYITHEASSLGEIREVPKSVQAIANPEGKYEFGEIVMQGKFGTSYELLFKAFDTSFQTIRSLRVGPIQVERCDGREAEYGPLNTKQCLACPAFAECNGSPYVSAQDGYYRASADSYVMYECTPPYGAGACVGNGECKEGYEGVRCSVCKPGYGKTGLFCQECFPQWANIVLLILLCGAMIAFIMFLTFNSIQSGLESIHEETELLDDFGKPIGKSSNSRNMIPIVLKIIINHFQIVSLAPRTDAAMPGFVKDFLEGQGTVSSFTPTLNFISCEVAPTYYDTFLITMIAPPVMFGVFLIISFFKTRSFKRQTAEIESAGDLAGTQQVYELELRRSRRELLGIDEGEWREVGHKHRNDYTTEDALIDVFGNREKQEAEAEDVEKQILVNMASKNQDQLRKKVFFSDFLKQKDKPFWMRFYETAAVSGVVVLFFLYPTLLQVCTDILECDEIDYGNGETRHFLAVDRAIECYSGEHNRYRVLAMILLITYGAGIPMIVVFSVKSVGKLTMDGNFRSAKKLFFFLTGGFTEGWWFWECFVLMRKASIVVVITVIQDERIKTYVAMWILLGFLVLNVVASPWSDTDMAIMEGASLLTISITFNMLLLLPFFPEKDAPVAYWIIVVILFVINVAMLALFAFVLRKAVASWLKTFLAKRPNLQAAVGGIFQTSDNEIKLKTKYLQTETSRFRASLAEAHRRSSLVAELNKDLIHLLSQNPHLLSNPTVVHADAVIKEINLLTRTINHNEDNSEYLEKSMLIHASSPAAKVEAEAKNELGSPHTQVNMSPERRDTVVSCQDIDDVDITVIGSSNVSSGPSNGATPRLSIATQPEFLLSAQPAIEVQKPTPLAKMMDSESQKRSFEKDAQSFFATSSSPAAAVPRVGATTSNNTNNKKTEKESEAADDLELTFSANIQAEEGSRHGTGAAVAEPGVIVAILNTTQATPNHHEIFDTDNFSMSSEEEDGHSKGGAERNPAANAEEKDFWDDVADEEAEGANRTRRKRTIDLASVSMLSQRSSFAAVSRNEIDVSVAAKSLATTPSSSFPSPSSSFQSPAAAATDEQQHKPRFKFHRGDKLAPASNRSSFNHEEGAEEGSPLKDDDTDNTIGTVRSRKASVLNAAEQSIRYKLQQQAVKKVQSPNSSINSFPSKNASPTSNNHSNRISFRRTTSTEHLDGEDSFSFSDSDSEEQEKRLKLMALARKRSTSGSGSGGASTRSSDGHNSPIRGIALPQVYRTTQDGGLAVTDGTTSAEGQQQQQPQQLSRRGSSYSISPSVSQPVLVPTGIVNHDELCHLLLLEHTLLELVLEIYSNINGSKAQEEILNAIQRKK